MKSLLQHLTSIRKFRSVRRSCTATIRESRIVRFSQLLHCLKIQNSLNAVIRNFRITDTDVNVGQLAEDHFPDVRNMVEIGSGTHHEKSQTVYCGNLVMIRSRLESLNPSNSMGLKCPSEVRV